MSTKTQYDKERGTCPHCGRTVELYRRRIGAHYGRGPETTCLGSGEKPTDSGASGAES